MQAAGRLAEVYMWEDREEHIFDRCSIRVITSDYNQSLGHEGNPPTETKETTSIGNTLCLFPQGDFYASGGWAS